MPENVRAPRSIRQHSVIRENVRQRSVDMPHATLQA